MALVGSDVPAACFAYGGGIASPLSRVPPDCGATAVFAEGSAAGRLGTTSSLATGALLLVAGGGVRRRRAARLQRAAAATEAEAGRRGLLVLGLAGVGGALSVAQPASAEEKVTPEVLAQARADLEKLIKADANKGPTLVRLAWHSSGTYDKMSKTGGSGPGTIRFKEELAHGGNAGLDKAIKWLEPVKAANPGMSWADLCTLSGVVAIKSLGGPDVPWRAGRVDSMDPKDVTPDGRLPNADNGSYSKDSAHLREIFYRMGFNDQAIVALSGAHALGRCHADASGFVGPWTPTPTMFNNAYFTLLKNLAWEEGCIKGETCKNHQYADPSKQLMMLPTDIALINDPSFKKYVDVYASDEKAFFKDFSQSFSTLLELGTKGLYVV
mmetsp:Transcript_2856/g.6717  ORF Transcript_2856/g.6717 Transcript_2856/m.6717 type:complete len:383 (+) Transcript_2856:53-1201(+)|eukprot:CAMPEP_0170590780 /NCGR_PEP_ID=MMETSP0224-20130122/12051_1 /TAXON_ID=285029 /ORGANISM="Togula jolla, Strain CCCM 725" /LENGTH=382 /DNA_ID=CAMNT_0010914597 /DNA_START=52 /DNA_END=1200 /DNA_ORIENTATION=+